MTVDESGGLKRTSGHMAVYVTNHGFGHINRVVAVLNHLPETVRVTVRADAEVRTTLEERLRRAFEFGEFPSDNGTASPPGQNSRTDIALTFEKLEKRSEEIRKASDRELEWLRTSGVTAVYADSSPMPMGLAAQASLPGFLVANFSWDEIYADLLSRAGPEEISEVRRPVYLELVERMRLACRQATLVRCWPHTPMLGIGRSTVDVGLVVNKARNVRDDLMRRFRLKPETKLIYFYVGRYGVEDLPWERLLKFPPEFVFIGLHPPGREMPGRFLTVDPSEFNGADLLRSSDAAVVKAGYGAVAEAMAAGTPVIYPPRSGFVEFDALDQALRAWSGGLPVSEEDFASLNIGKALEAAVKSRAERPDAPLDGAADVARLISNTNV